MSSLQDFIHKPAAPCYCRGPQNGEPVCPCMMRDVRVIDGRYMRVTDLGPAPNGGLPTRMLQVPKSEPGVEQRVADLERRVRELSSRTTPFVRLG